MSRYIDADKLINELEPVIKSAAFKNRNIRSNVNKCLEIVNNQPTADVRENIKGEWIRRDSRYVGWISFNCSVCGETLELDRETSSDFKYCPFCGADMRGEQDG